MKNLNYQVGKIGELLAKKYLLKKEYQILASNFRTRFGEIDLVAGKNQTLVFAEVKLKIGEEFGSPEEMIDKKKLIQVQKTAEYFLQIYPEVAAKYPFYQIDAVCIVLNADGSCKRITHWENLEL